MYLYKDEVRNIKRDISLQFYGTDLNMSCKNDLMSEFTFEKAEVQDTRIGDSKERKTSFHKEFHPRS